MTTTLRPTGPIQQGADGAKIRAYDVCDNGRPVGAVEIGTDPAFGARAGVLRALRIDGPSRRRGRGTIAALAAEEVLRGWGCAQVRLTAPADDPAALGLAAVLGYAERSRNMLKRLPGTPPALPDTVTARPMSDEEYARWDRASRVAYAQNWIDQGVPEDQARRKSDLDHSTNLPDGLATEGAHMHVLLREDRVVGHVWVARHGVTAEDTVAYVFDVEVREEHRGQGHGRALMLQAENIALASGERRIGLHVFADNVPALRLYESLGYEPTMYNLAKDL
ncbi:GNAT family N-acetyltransferase [Streptomyces sp. AM 4-1-1]|uniref:GNAT family N-acetyltransferase n=1 Tax=Streptomyces sp. AM 4-1-1 TaxID=3028710 RepID=UPI0023B8F331|nr:GNAT family N-acetyltransferase [Streptomyces sp. AM 4-1-1]WEH32534.1 GNAT family N-acetyltransferase [Streptomyces sp. AM 4-1-1]